MSNAKWKPSKQQRELLEAWRRMDPPLFPCFSGVPRTDWRMAALTAWIASAARDSTAPRPSPVIPGK